MVDLVDSYLLRQRLREAADDALAAHRREGRIVRWALRLGIVLLGLGIALAALSVVVLGQPVLRTMVTNLPAFVAAPIFIWTTALRRRRRTRLVRQALATAFIKHAHQHPEGYRHENLVAIGVLRERVLADPGDMLPAVYEAMHLSTPRNALLLAAAAQMIEASDPGLFSKEQRP